MSRAKTKTNKRNAARLEQKAARQASVALFKSSPVPSVLEWATVRIYSGLRVCNHIVTGMAGRERAHTLCNGTVGTMAVRRYSVTERPIHHCTRCVAELTNMAEKESESS